MTATFFLVRHAAHGLLDKVLVGRMAGVSLSAEGSLQAERVAARLAREKLDAVQASPQQRAQETAAQIASRTGLAVAIVPALDEIDLGDWSGRGFAELDGRADWRDWNERRSEARAPDGESMREAQSRVVEHLDRTGSEAPEARIALVSHADIIKAAILHYLGASLDAFGRIEISPASISTLVVGAWGGKLLNLNETVA